MEGELPETKFEWTVNRETLISNSISCYEQRKYFSLLNKLFLSTYKGTYWCVL